jgi:hypothetical protein
MIRWYNINDDKSIELLPVDHKFNDKYFNDANRRVGDDTVDDQRVSTVFLYMDHNWSEDGTHTPILFETMIFGGEYDQEMWRYSTYDEAKAGHDRIVNCLKKGTNPTL